MHDLTELTRSVNVHVEQLKRMKAFSAKSEKDLENIYSAVVGAIQSNAELLLEVTRQLEELKGAGKAL